AGRASASAARVSGLSFRVRSSAPNRRNSGLVADVRAAPPLAADSSTSENLENVDVSMKNNSNRKMTSMSDVIDNLFRLRRTLNMLWRGARGRARLRGAARTQNGGDCALGDDAFVVHAAFEPAKDQRRRHCHDQPDSRGQQRHPDTP